MDEAPLEEAPRNSARANAVAPVDVGIMAPGLLAFISGFLPWYGTTFFGTDITASGWRSEFLGWFPLVLSIAVAATVAVMTFGHVALPAAGPIGPRLILLSVTGLATLLIFLRWVTLPDYTGARAGLFIGLIAIVAQTVFAVMAFRASKETLQRARPNAIP
jgi:hypothetical protein